MQTFIAPSILSADFAHLGAEVQAVVEAGADWVHVDVMDGHFVPNITFGPDLVRSIRKLTDRPFDTHLMVAPVDLHLAAFAEAGADRLTVHAEAGPHLDRSLQAVRHLGKRAGVAICPATPEQAVGYVLDAVDLVLVMTVNPGFGGQSFIPAMLDKIARVRAMIGSRDIRIEVDGGINAETAAQCRQAGASALVAGTSVFHGGPEAYARNITALRGVTALG